MSSKIKISSHNEKPPQQYRWHAYPTSTSLENAATQLIMKAAQQAIETNGTFHIVLAGGTTPRRVYELLRTKVTDWNKWHIYFGDERCLPADHPERNSLMAADAWLNHVCIPANQIHAIPAEKGAESAARDYSQTVNKIELFDLVLLGLGEDGHTASLFPEHDWGTAANAPSTLAVHNAPKPPAERVTLTARRLSKSRQLLFLVSGRTKEQAINQWRNGHIIPAAAITPDCGVDIYLDEQLLHPIEH